MIEILKYKPKKFFKRNGVTCLLCTVRNRLIKQVPEELIRQAFINYLIINKKIPVENIGVEIPLTRFKNGNRNRADIVVYGDSSKKTVVMVVECKKEHWGITDKNIDQVKNYNTVFKSNCIVITNGKYFYSYKKFGANYKEINIIPNFRQLRENQSLKGNIIKDIPYERHLLKEIYETSTFNYFLNWGHIGVDTKLDLYPFICNFVDLLFDKKSDFENLSFKGFKIIKDLGTVIDSFGNAAGGNWSGEYKKLLIQDSFGNHQTVGLGVFGSSKFKNHPQFGNSRGYTYLIVSIDDYDKSHNSLQLNIDKHVLLNNGFYHITHNGKLTNGHRGSLPLNTVVNYIKKNAPHLITKHDKLQLGVLPDKKLFRHTDKDVVSLIGNLVHYALLRDELRRLYK